MLRTLIILALFIAPALAAPAAQLAKDRAAAAEKTFRAVAAKQKVGRATVEQVYDWSVRWLGSELDAARPAKQALADHAARMKDLETESAAAYTAGKVGADESDAATYFRLEADYWVAKGKR